MTRAPGGGAALARGGRVRCGRETRRFIPRRVLQLPSRQRAAHSHRRCHLDSTPPIPVAETGGTVTAGNSSQMSDGAAAAVLAAGDVARKEGWPVLGWLRAYQVAGVPPEIMGIGPVAAIPKALAKAGLSIGDIDLVEIKLSGGVLVLTVK